MRTLLVLFVLTCNTAFAETPDERHAYETLKKLVSIPNTSEHPEGLEKTADAIFAMMKELDLKPQKLKVQGAKMPPVVFGEWTVPGATQTTLLYAHYDGVRVKPEKWTVTKPFQPLLLSDAVDAGGKPVAENAPLLPEMRLYGRSAADDKAGVVAILSAIRLAKKSGELPKSNLKLIFEGEEEEGSEHLEQVLKENAQLVRSDGWVIIDGPQHPSARDTVVFGVRGSNHVDLTVYGPSRGLHSGHYSGWTPNPAMILAHLLASMQDQKTGKVLITGFEADSAPLGKLEKKALSEIPPVDSAMMKTLGFSRKERPHTFLAEAITHPSLIIRGIQSGKVGDDATNTIPAEATASLEMRLVKGNDSVKHAGLIATHVKKQGFHVLDRAPTDEERAKHPFIAKVVVRDPGYNAERLEMDHPFAKSVVAAIQRTSSEPIVRLPTMGASLPIAMIRRATGAPVLLFSLTNFDNNQHSENENLKLGNLWKGIASVQALLLN